MKYIVANWKMNGRRAFVNDWFHQWPDQWPDNVVVVVAPPFTLLSDTRAVKPNRLALAAQDISMNVDDGAHTGEVSGAMLKDSGCEYVIVGHSERRVTESHEQIDAKLKAACTAGLTPILCVGEPLDVRMQGRAQEFVEDQLKSLDGLSPEVSVMIAYEPVWAIGTGMTAEPKDIEDMHRHIRGFYDVPILYGGSVKGANAVELLSVSGVDGALVGGASLKPAEFLSIVAAGA